MPKDSQYHVEPVEGFSWEGKKLLVFVNPYGGSGTGKTIWENQVIPVFTENEIDYEVIETTRRGHASEYLQEADIYQYFGIVAIGGDGTMHEVLNALYKRPDSDRAVTVPLAPIPGGTGNGLAHSLGARDPITAAKNIARGQVSPMDLIRVRIGDTLERLACLSISWGLVGDFDVLSEKALRWMGFLRAAVIPIYIILRCQSYWGRITYLPHDAKNLDGSDESEWRTIESDVVCLVACNVPWLAPDVKFGPRARPDDGSIDIVIMRAPVSRMRIFQMFNQLGDGRHETSPEVEYQKARRFRIEPNEQQPGSWVIDGEAMEEYKTINVEVLPSKGRFFYSHSDLIR